MARMAVLKAMAAAAVLSLLPIRAWAVPGLQLYVEGGTYDSATGTWTAPLKTGSIRLWAIGNVAGPGGQGAINDVKLAVAYPSSAEAKFVFDTAGVSAENYAKNYKTNIAVTDPSEASAPQWNKTVTDGSSPTSIPSEGIYGAGTDWQEFSLGDFTLTDSPIANFVGQFPTSSWKKDGGQINVYEFKQTGLVHGDFVHFDIYNRDEVGSGDVTINVVPEPATLLLLGTGLLGLGGVARRRTTGKGSQTS